MKVLLFLVTFSLSSACTGDSIEREKQVSFFEGCILSLAAYTRTVDYSDKAINDFCVSLYLNFEMFKIRVPHEENTLEQRDERLDI